MESQIEYYKMQELFDKAKNVVKTSIEQAIGETYQNGYQDGYNDGRDARLNQFNKLGGKTFEKFSYDRGYEKGFEDGKLQAIEKAEWLDRKNMIRIGNIDTAKGLRWKYECSCCGYEILNKTKYCPSCGAKMI